jgi:hypothetical protein
LARLWWLEQHGIAAQAESWRERAELLRATMTGASDQTSRDILDDRADTWEQAAEELDGMLSDSHAGPPDATDTDWAVWHCAELGRLLEKLAGESGPEAAAAFRAVMDQAGGPLPPVAEDEAEVRVHFHPPRAKARSDG